MDDAVQAALEQRLAQVLDTAARGSTLTVRFGKLGSAGQTQTRILESPDAAAREIYKLVREKTRKGYREVAG